MGDGYDHIYAHESRPKPGQTICGDRCGAWLADGKWTLAVADGLGHGPEAAAAAEAAITYFSQHLGEDIETGFKGCDKALLNTRGVALAIAIVDLANRQLTLASVGNIRAVLLRGPRELRLGGCGGIVGNGFNRLVPDILELEPGDRLFLFTDGFSEGIPLRDILAHQPAPCQTVRLLIDRFTTGTDDAAVLAYLHLPGLPSAPKIA